MPGETELIERYFRLLGAVRPDVVLGIGDDAAVLRVPPGHELVQTTDCLVEGAHFLAGDDPESIGHRLLAANLSDIAAMGATPAWALLSLTLPAVDEAWLGAFARGFGLLARAHGVALAGGNLARGPLNASVTLTGLVPAGTALRRGGARAGDALWVSGWPGDARAGLALRHPGLPGMPGFAGDEAVAGPARGELIARWERPEARVALGQALRGVATACIDVSDGLACDLACLAGASGCGALVDADALPVSPALRAVAGCAAWQEVLAGGEDYELCFAAPAGAGAAVAGAAAAAGVPVACIGRLQPGAGLHVAHDGAVTQFTPRGYDHLRG